jgi:hypothetical protein
MLKQQHVIHERSNIIPINIVKNNIKNKSQICNQYSLKHNWFDPTKHSPPNQFMINLYNRFHNYNTTPFHKNDDNFDKT